MINHWLVATDLDGTLLDGSYPEQRAISVVQQLLARGQVQVALASSKTAAELLHMVRDLDRDQPLPFLVFENGGGWAWPDKSGSNPGVWSEHGYEVAHAGMPYPEICTVLRELRQQGFRFHGFADMDNAEVSERTGLSESQAELARARLCSEPLLWLGDSAEQEVFKTHLEKLGLSLVRGGRFFHVGSAAGKCWAVSQIKHLLAERYGTAPLVVACGDAPNDTEMLRSADYAVLFPGEVADQFSCSKGDLLGASPRISHADRAGPEAWLTAVNDVLNLGRTL